MKKMYRNMLLFSSTVVFLAVAPLIVLYAMGYRMGASPVDPLPLGVLLIETTPRRAQLVVNDIQHGETPRSVSGLIPGDARISITKEGYQEWQKTIRIEPSLLSEFRDIRLFPSDIKKTTIATEVTSFSLSPNRTLVAVLTVDKKLVVVDEEGQLINNPVQLTALPSELLWSPDSTSLLVLYKKGAGHIIVVADADQQPIFQKTLTGIKQAVWDPRVPGRLLLLTTAGELKAYSHVNNSTYQISKGVETFATSSKMIYAVDANGILNTYTFSGEPTGVVNFNMPSPIEELFITPANKRVVQTADKTLYLVPDAGEPLKVAEHVLSTGWSPDGQLLYVQPESNELYVYNAGVDRLPWLPIKELQLVVRLSRPIVNPQWFAGGRHLIYQTNDEVMISEVDTRDHALQYRIDSTNMGDAQTAVGTDGERLFYLSKNKETTELTVASLLVTTN